MATSVFKFNTYLFFKLPAAWWCGVRLNRITENAADVSVTHRWINQNPFNSMFWAVQGMAAELATGAMVIDQIKQSGQSISMLVAHNKASFTKKATGRIVFSCEDGHLIAPAIQKTITTGEGETFWMKAIGINELGVSVATFEFQWTIKKKQ